MNCDPAVSGGDDDDHSERDAHQPSLTSGPAVSGRLSL